VRGRDGLPSMSRSYFRKKISLKFIGLLTCMMGALFAVSCGGNGSTTTTTQQQAIAIEFQPAPVASITLNSNAQFTAVVQNDPNNYGVDWCIAGQGQACGTTCSPSVCGNFSSGSSTAHSSSGEAVTYYPPTSLTGNQVTMNILAFATADHSKNLTAPLKIMGYSGNLSGEYVFEVKGSTLDPKTLLPAVYEFGGVVSLDGNGGISLSPANGQQVGGEFTYSTPAGAGSGYITGGSYSLGSDGRGTLTMITTSMSIGAKGTATFNLMFLSGSQVLIAEADAGASASGSMDLQTQATAPTGGFAFASSGADSNGNSIGFGGVMNIDVAGGGISGHGSVSDVMYLGSTQNCPSPAGLTGTVASPDQFGAVQIELNACFTTTPLQSTGLGFATAGFAIGQGSSTGVVTVAGLASNYVYGLVGTDSSGIPNSLTTAALFSPSQTGTFTGTGDEFATTLAISDTFAGSYTIDTSGIGRIDAPLAFTNPSNASASAPELFFYLTGANQPALVVSADTSAGGSAIGIAYPQAQASLTFNGSYGMVATNVTSQSEFDLTGEMTASGASTSITGLLDGSGGYGGGLPFYAMPLTGTFVTPPTNARFTGQLVANDSGGSSLIVPTQIEFYLIDSSHGFMIETDTAAELLGYFASKSPVCAGCQ
jgi:hypothetical protein